MGIYTMTDRAPNANEKRRDLICHRDKSLLADDELHFPWSVVVVYDGKSI